MVRAKRLESRAVSRDEPEIRWPLEREGANHEDFLRRRARDERLNARVRAFWEMQQRVNHVQRAS